MVIYKGVLDMKMVSSSLSVVFLVLNVAKFNYTSYSLQCFAFSHFQDLFESS